MDENLLKQVNHKYDVVVVGGGCAGVEVFGIASTIVYPPANAALVPVNTSSL